MIGKTGKTAVSRRGSGLGAYFPDWINEMFFGRPKAKRMSLEDALSTEKKGRQQLVDVVLPNSFVLERTLTNPPRARRNWHSFAGLDLVRQTPFSADQVQWTLTQDRSGDKVKLTQWVAKTSEIDNVTARLATRGRVPHRFLFMVDGALTVLTEGHRSRRRGLVMLNAVLALVAVGAVSFAWLSPAWSAKEQADLLERQLQTQRSRAVTLRGDLETIRQIDAERTAFLDSLARNPRVVTQLRESTVNLPNTVWLNEWTYDQGGMRLAGEVDGSAADLVLALSEKVRGWSPALSGAVSSTPDGNQRFEITIAVARGGQ